MATDVKTNPFAMWIRLYANAIGVSENALRGKTGGAHIRNFNTRLMPIKHDRNWSSEIATGFVYFCYSINPLNVPAQNYGDLTTLMSCVVPYENWRREHEFAIAQYGILKAISDTCREKGDVKMAEIYHL